MKCPLDGCPNDATGGLACDDAKRGSRWARDYDPLCPDHATLARARSVAGNADPRTPTGRAIRERARLLWKRAKGGGLPVPDEDWPTFDENGAMRRPKERA